jgi:hypothetical protein
MSSNKFLHHHPNSSALIHTIVDESDISPVLPLMFF